MTTCNLLIPIIWLVQLFNGCQISVESPAAGLQYVASTPGDDAAIIKYLGLPTDTPSDFVRWDLKLHENQTFNLNIHYGVSKANTLGFINNGTQKSIQGSFIRSKSTESLLDKYDFSSEDLKVRFSTVQINENLLHLLDDQGKLMVGNGGWSYTLNKKVDQGQETENLIMKPTVSKIFKPAACDTFIGRTPSARFSQDHGLTSNSKNFKLKWRIILNRDPSSLLPTTYHLRNVINNEPNELLGTWQIITGTAEYPDALIYQLDFAQPIPSIRLLVGDENVLFFLDKQNRLYTGNSDFSFTMNRKNNL